MQITMTQVIAEMEDWIATVQFDLSQDFLSDKERKEFATHLCQLISAIALIKDIADTGGQIFNSAIHK
jgi:hypothetical protein